MQSQEGTQGRWSSPVHTPMACCCVNSDDAATSSIYGSTRIVLSPAPQACDQPAKRPCQNLAKAVGVHCGPDSANARLCSIVAAAHG